MAKPNPTPEQQSIVDAAKADGPSIIMNAYAGCAKTTTLELVAQATPNVPTLALAFNVRIKKELEKKFPDSYQVKTLNGLGHAAWGRAIGKNLTLDERKLGKIVGQVLKDNDCQDKDAWEVVLNITRKAMMLGLVPSHFPHKSLVPDEQRTWLAIADDLWIDRDVEWMCKLARLALIESIRQGFNGTISFDDQIYLSCMFNGVFQKYPRVLGDEAQDFSPLNHLMIKRSAAGRLLLAGDRKQAIYGFRGADHSSMDNIKSIRKEWTELPLATTFRCPKVVVERQQHHAPGFTPWHTNAEGQFLNWAIKPGNGVAPHEWNWTHIMDLTESIPTPNATIAVICRNNAPLLELAFKLIRQGVGPVMLGRDIGKNLLTLAKKITPEADTPIDTCQKAIREWQSNETAKAMANGQEHKLAAISDRAECLLAVADSSDVTTAGGMWQALDELFSRQHGRVTLTSGHRSKGFEWDLVVHLDPWRVPSRHAKSAAAEGDYAPLEQERNLLYVIETRAKHTLVNASILDFT